MKQLISLLFILLLSQGVSAQLTFAGKPFPVQCNLFDSMRNVVIKGGIDSLVKTELLSLNLQTDPDRTS